MSTTVDLANKNVVNIVIYLKKVISVLISVNNSFVIVPRIISTTR